MYKIQRPLRIRRALHIHPHKPRRIHRRSFCHQPTHDIPCHPLIHIQAHVSELEADVGVEVIRGYGIEDVVIELRAVASFVDDSAVPTEIVDADAHARSIDGLRNANGIGDLGSGNESAGDPLTKSRTLGKIAQTTIFRQLDEEGPQHGVPTTSKMDLSWSKGNGRASGDKKTTEFCITSDSVLGVTRITMGGNLLGRFPPWNDRLTRCSASCK